MLISIYAKNIQLASSGDDFDFVLTTQESRKYSLFDVILSAWSLANGTKVNLK